MSKANVNNNNNNEYIYIPELEEGMTATAVVDGIVNKNIERKKKKNARKNTESVLAAVVVK